MSLFRTSLFLQTARYSTCRDIKLAKLKKRKNYLRFARKKSRLIFKILPENSFVELLI